MIPGATVELGGQTFVAAPLNFKALKHYAGFIGAIGDKFTLSDLDSVVGIIAASLRRNHPDITDDFLDEHVDMANAGELLGAVLRASGGKVVNAPQGEA